MTDAEIAGPVVRYEREGRIGRIVLNRPAALNAITVELGAGLETALRTLGADPEVSVITVHGAGGNFCVGGDFDEVSRLREGGAGALQPLFDNFARACTAIGEVNNPVVCIVEGYAMAGGFELVLAADITLVHDDAVLCDNHSNFGQIPGGGSTQRLPRLIGLQRALGLILSGDRLSGRQAAEWGIAYRSYPAASFEEGVAEFVERLAAKSPTALTQVKQLVRRGLEGSLSDGLRCERDAVVGFIAGEAGASGVNQFRARGA